MINFIKQKYALLDENSLEVIKKSISSMITKISGMVIGFFVSIVLARLLGADGIGVINLSSRIVSIILILALLGIPQVIVKEVSIAKAQQSWRHIGNVMYSSYLVCGLVTLLVSILFIFLAPWIANTIFHEERLTFPLIMALLAMTPQVFSRLFSSGLIGYRKIWQSNLVDQTLSVVVIGVLLLVLYLVNVEITINLVAVLYVIGRLFVTLTVGLYWRKLYSHKFEKTNIRKKLLRTSLPLMLVSATVVISSSIDSIMIGWFGDTKQIGIYNIAVNLALLSSFFLQVSASVLSPMISSLYQENKIDELSKLLQRVTKVLFIISLIPLPFFILFGKKILSIWGLEFVEGYLILIVITIGQIVNIGSGPAGVTLAMCGLEKKLSKIKMIELITNVFLNLVLISMYQALGAAIATSITMILFNVAKVIYLRKELGIKLLKL